MAQPPGKASHEKADRRRPGRRTDAGCIRGAESATPAARYSPGIADIMVMTQIRHAKLGSPATRAIGIWRITSSTS
jgi:hypothetical protein